MKYEFYGKSLYLVKDKILVITDLHLGYEQALNEAGVFFPRSQFKEIIDELNEIFSVLKEKNENVEKVVILGDLKHKFGEVSRQEWEDVLELLDFLLEKTKKIILIKGNHDSILEPIVKRKGIKIFDFYIENEICFFHGNKIFPEIFDKKVKFLVLGHKHPAITIRKNVKVEIYKCFLVGKYKGKDVLILPSFFPFVEGSDVFVDDNNLGLELNFDNFEVYVPVSVKEVLKFGKVKEVGKLNV